MTTPVRPTPAVECASIRAGYVDHMVLHDVSFTAEAGELVGLIGPNGAGKSTLLKTLSGVVRPTSGAVRIYGRDLAAYRARDLAQTMAYVPQSEPTLFDFTVREVVLMGRHPHSRKATASASRSCTADRTVTDHAIAARAMAATDVLHLAERPVTALSGGEHRRVILARAIAQSPSIMLLDEPTAHLDIAHQSEMLRLISRMTRREGLCAIAALHDLNVAAEWCDRLVLLANGRILADGPPATVLASSSLQTAYGIPFQLSANPVTARPMVTPVLRGDDKASPDAPYIHVICGGGTGSAMMAELARAGYRLTAGVLNRLDTDEGVTSALGIPCATEEPFSPISDGSYQMALDLAARARLVVIAPIPVGHGNLRNLNLASELAGRGARLIVVDDPPVEARDFTDGSGQRAWSQLLTQAARVLVGDDSVVAAVRDVVGDPSPHVPPPTEAI
ncbi:MAG: ABC transporter ATP-binding protein [Chthonomonadales bacterium]|nr:ABC transporter ATP-binding protein [Chthonomonadales bacterium]